MMKWFRRKDEQVPAEKNAAKSDAPEAYESWQPEAPEVKLQPEVPEVKLQPEAPEAKLQPEAPETSAAAPEMPAARPVVTQADVQSSDAAPTPPVAESDTDNEPVAVPHGMSADDPLGPPILKALQSVYDPEIPVDIYQLGLIYSVEVSPEKDVSILMTLTTPGCPVAGEMPGMVEYAVQSQVEEVRDVEVEIVWEPPWTPELMSEAARLELGFM